MARRPTVAAGDGRGAEVVGCCQSRAVEDIRWPAVVARALRLDGLVWPLVVVGGRGGRSCRSHVAGASHVGGVAQQGGGGFGRRKMMQRWRGRAIP